MTSTRSQPGSGSRSTGPRRPRPRGGVQGFRSLDAGAVARAADESGIQAGRRRGLVRGRAHGSRRRAASVGRPDPRRDGLPHSRPADRGAEEVDWLDHVSALELTELPETLWSSAAARSGSSSRRRSRASARRSRSSKASTGSPSGTTRRLRPSSPPRSGTRASRSSRAPSSTASPRPGCPRRDGRGPGDPCRPVLLAAGRTPNVEELEPRASGNRAHEGGHRGRRSPAHERRRRLGGGRRDRPVPVHADRSVPGACSRRGHVHRRRPRRRLLGAADRDLHRPGARPESGRPSAKRARRGSRRGGRHAPGVGSDARSTRTRSAGSTRSSSSARRSGSSESTWSTAPRLRSCRRSRSR